MQGAIVCALRASGLVRIEHSGLCAAGSRASRQPELRHRWSRARLVDGERAAAARGRDVQAAARTSSCRSTRTFKDENGPRRHAGRVLRRSRPVVLAFVYYQCPMLCTQVMNGISSAAEGAAVQRRARTSTSCSSASIRATRPEAAAPRRSGAPRTTGRRENQAAGWHFLTGDEATIQPGDVGGGLHLPVGRADAAVRARERRARGRRRTARLSRYFYGVEYSPKELRLALVESGQGHVGSVDRRAAALLLSTTTRRAAATAWSS